MQILKYDLQRGTVNICCALNIKIADSRSIHSFLEIWPLAVFVFDFIKCYLNLFFMKTSGSKNIQQTQHLIPISFNILGEHDATQSAFIG